MNFKNTASRYGIVTKFFHWTIFILFVFQFVLGFTIMGSATGEEFDSSRLTLINWHKSTGILILALAIFRIVWRRTTPLPNWSETLTKRERKLYHWIELSLYSIMILKPLSGYMLAVADGQIILFFGLFAIPNVYGESAIMADVSLALHIITGIIFFIAWFAHIGLVFKHQFVNKDRLLKRMLPFTHQ